MQMLYQSSVFWDFYYLEYRTRRKQRLKTLKFNGGLLKEGINGGLLKKQKVGGVSRYCCEGFGYTCDVRLVCDILCHV